MGGGGGRGRWGVEGSAIADWARIAVLFLASDPAPTLLLLDMNHKSS